MSGEKPKPAPFENMRGQCALVTGASSIIGHYLLPRLRAEGFNVVAISRKPETTFESSGVVWLSREIKNGLGDMGEYSPSLLIHLAPLWTLPGLIESARASGIKRIIAFGSTSMYGKMDSMNPAERNVVKALSDAEQSVAEKCASANIPWTVFRPSLIYGGGMDKNVTTIKNFIEKTGFFVIAGEGSGLRSPVHADDLAAACLRAAGNAKSFNKAYNLCGGEVMPYRRMVEMIFESLGKKPAILSLPLAPLRLAARIACFIPSLRHVTPDMADRMNKDLAYSHAEAVADFGYSPRNFAPAS